MDVAKLGVLVKYRWDVDQSSTDGAAVTQAAINSAAQAEEASLCSDVNRMAINDVMRIFIQKPGFLLNRIDQIANALYGALSGGRETLAQAEMMLAIAANAGSDQVGLARACGIDTSTTAIILSNLRMTSLVARVQDASDLRRSLPVLTEAGRRQLPDVAAAFQDLQAELLAPLDPPTAKLLLSHLTKLVNTPSDCAPRWDREASPFAQAPSMLFRRALQISHARFNAQVGAMPVTLRQFSALLILDLHPGLSQVEFARVYGLDPSTCAVVLKKLVSRGLLRTGHSALDRRKNLYFTTQEGHDQIAILQALADQSEMQAVADLSTQSFQELIPPLQSIIRRHSVRLRYPGCLPWD